MLWVFVVLRMFHSHANPDFHSRAHQYNKHRVQTQGIILCRWITTIPSVACFMLSCIHDLLYSGVIMGTAVILSDTTVKRKNHTNRNNTMSIELFMPGRLMLLYCAIWSTVHTKVLRAALLAGMYCKSYSFLAFTGRSVPIQKRAPPYLAASSSSSSSS